jgi:hypothetical protein
MGAQEFSTKGRGKDLKTAYDNAYAKAVAEFGHQEGYSGEMNSTVDHMDITNEFKHRNQPIGAFMQYKLKTCDKGMCYSVCLKESKKNTNKVKSVVKNIVTPGTRKWILKYEVIRRIVREGDDPLATFDSKGAAIKFARKYTEDNLYATEIYMSKVLEKGPAKVAEISYKGSKNEIEGEWIFFGIAAC